MFSKVINTSCMRMGFDFLGVKPLFNPFAKHVLVRSDGCSCRLTDWECLDHFSLEDDDATDGRFFIHFDNAIWPVRVESLEVLFALFDD